VSKSEGGGHDEGQSEAGGRDRLIPENPASAGATGALLAADEPLPYEVSGHDARSRFVIGCDHAGRRLPRQLGSLGLSPADLDRHIAWDIGAAGVARRLATVLDAFVVCQRYSRLVIDCNRPLASPESIATLSENTTIPGNLDVSPAEAARRAREIFHPYHDQIRAELDRRRQAGRPSVFVAIHSFTPVFKQWSRPWHAGVLYNRDARLAEPMLRLLRAEGDLAVGCNEPYAASEQTDFSIVHHGEQRGIPQVELEVRQDLIADQAGQTAWAERLARLLVAAAQGL
jgi:predicted N-formylglutamate amidohydrolase